MNKTITILRHGEAEVSSGVDRNRVLTEKGIHGSCCAAKSILDLLSPKQKLDAIFHSPFKRTSQTAHEIFNFLSSSLDAPLLACTPCEFLLEDTEPKVVGDWLNSLTMNHVLLVSHQPLVSRLVAWLVDGMNDVQHDPNIYFFNPASMFIIETDFISGGCGFIRSEYHYKTH